MAKILIIEDRPMRRERVKNILEEKKHEIILVNGATTGDLFNELTDWLDNNKHEIIDFLILDIMYDKEDTGGLHLYSQLESTKKYNINGIFRNIIILTQIFKDGSEEDGDKTVQFFTSRGVPSANIIDYSDSSVNLTSLINRIDELSR